MVIQIIKKDQGIVRKINENYQVTNFLTKEISENLSLAVSEATNHSETTKNTRSDRIYYVFEGKLIVKKDNKEFAAESGDIIFIPKNTKYCFEGTFKAILINTPPFNPQDEQISKL
ncbi:MAG: cupin domain-containing protein [Candidatus Aenigmarchaeota archaeon]|nr:cupin domain-containing protein [Candidatus Aenigmarchaeota archaeon]